MRFSLMTEPQLGGTYDQLLTLARWAEEKGLVSFARSDHYYVGRQPTPDATDAFATLAGLARDTTDIRLCVLVAPVTFRHPAVVAKTAATIDQMSGGRLDLGIGTGWMDLEHEVFGLPFPDFGERFARLEETLGYLEAAFSDGHARFEGTHYSLDAVVGPTPTGIRIVVGGSGKRRTPTLAGVHADEYNHLVAPPEAIAPKIATMRRAAEEAGRDPAAVEVTVMGPIFAGRDRAEFDEKVRSAAEIRDEEPAALVERWESLGVVMGTPDQVTEKIDALSAAGVDRYYLQWLDVEDLEGLEVTYAIATG